MAIAAQEARPFDLEGVRVSVPELLVAEAGAGITSRSAAALNTAMALRLW